MTKRNIFQLDSSQSDKKETKVLSSRFQQYLGLADTLTAEGCSQKEPLRH